jgi:HEAT repeat protein
MRRLPLLCAVLLLLSTSALATALSRSDQEAATAFKRGDYDKIVKLLQALPPDQTPHRELVRLGFLSYLRLGRPDDALKLYGRLVSASQPDDPDLLRQLALSLITSRVRDPQEYIRIAAYTALAEIAVPETGPVLEDGLLDSSILVRARAAEAIGRAGLAGRSGALKRALQDEAPSVRIAAMNALADANVKEIRDQLVEIARVDVGPESIFATASLVKMGKNDLFIDLLDAATLPDPNVRMAALGVLGRLKRPSSLPVLSQAVYDPEPSVRAFAAGALGEFGQAGGVAPLTHALSDDNARVRGVAVTSLGRLMIPETRPLITPLTRDSVEHVRANAAEALIRLGDASAVLLAADLSRSADPSVRGASAQALAIASDQKALPILDALLRDQQPLPRLMAAQALGKVRLPNVLPSLKKGLQDTDVAVRIASAASVIQVLTRGKTAPPSRPRQP